MPSQSFRANSLHVIHETIEGEVILVNLENGSYYSAGQTAAFIWNQLTGGISVEQLVSRVMAEYSGDSEQMRESVTNLLAQLQEEGLVVPVAELPSPAAAPAPTRSAGEKQVFVPPLLEKYSEMENLLLLDPIHDVDDSGWPTRPPENPAQ